MTRQEHLKQWVSERYGDRRIPISGELYLDHVVAVGETAAGYAEFGFESGLCHDMLEDGICTEAELRDALADCQYDARAVATIVGMVVELTDGTYPNADKKERRKLEEYRLSHIGPAAQTVKYADLLYNIHWTIRYRPEKAKKYLRRKLRLLQRMDKGDVLLRQQVLFD